MNNEKTGPGDNEKGSRGQLRNAIADLISRHGGRGPDAPESRLARVAAKMAGANDGQQKPGKNYDLVAERLTLELQTPDPISLRRARDGAWCLWETKPAIGNSDPLLCLYLDQLGTLADKRASRALCNAYLVQYRNDRPGLKTVSRALEGLSVHAGDPYATLQTDLKLFSLPEGPEQLGQKALERRQPPVVVLQALGLSSAQLLQGGFVEPCAQIALERVAADSTLKPRERYEFVKALAVDEAGNLFFPQHKTAFANALLLPYDANNPPEDVLSETLALVIRAIGDPRSKAAEWRSMEEAARIARRWLTKESIDQFLDVVDEVALDRMWRWRRKFWNAVFDTKGGDGQSIVQEAWVVFDDVGYAQAKKMGIKNLAVGRFERYSNVQKGQSVLLLRIGKMVIAEWSHNGKVRIWHDAGREGAPKLYKPWYRGRELKGGFSSYYCDWDRSHTSPESCAWQDAVADKLCDLTGIRVLRSKYR